MRQHSDLTLAGVFDISGERAARFGSYHDVPAYSTLDDLLADEGVEIAVNLTNPANHYEVSRRCLEAGKHVYSEKPIALVFSEAKALVDLAQARGLYFSAAPCDILGEAAQTIWHALRSDAIGSVRLAYAAIDDGPIHLQHPDTWHSRSGIPWPYRNEFTVGCTLEHAAYYLTWLAAFFGPARTVTAFSSCLIPDKRVTESETLNGDTPDFSVACIQFHSGVVARLTCGIVAPFDHSMQIVGDTGVISIDECWNYHAPVSIRKYSSLGFRAEKHRLIRNSALLSRIFGVSGRSLRGPSKSSLNRRRARHYQDFSRGVAELAAAIRAGRPSRLPPSFCLHINELTLAIHDARETNTTRALTTVFEPLGPVSTPA